VYTLLSEESRQGLNEAKAALSETLCEGVYLVASMLATHAPLAEVLTVIPQQVIAALAEPRTGTAHHFRPISQTCGSRANPDLSSM
jgi:hypothetical protein